MYNTIIYGFTGDCYINEFDKYAHNVKKGDTFNNSVVVCVIKTKFENGGLCDWGYDNNNKEYISMYHPIFCSSSNSWKFAKDICDVEMLNEEERNYIGYMYNFVLSNTHKLGVNDILCATLGHNFKDDIVKHPFFGNREKFMNCIKYLPGYNAGVIILKESNYVTDENGEIINIEI